MTANLLSDDELRAAMSRLAEREQIANMTIDPIGMEPDSKESVVVARHIAALTEKLAAAEQVAADIETLLDLHYGVAIEPRDGMRRVRPYGYGVMSCEEPTLSAALRAAAAKLEPAGEK